MPQNFYLKECIAQKGFIKELGKLLGDIYNWRKHEETEYEMTDKAKKVSSVNCACNISSKIVSQLTAEKNKSYPGYSSPNGKKYFCHCKVWNDKTAEILQDYFKSKKILADQLESDV